MVKRQNIIEKFLYINGWPKAQRVKLTSDASFRTYYRLTDHERGAILMDAPPNLEQIGQFLKIAKHLKALGYSTPAIFAADKKMGLALIEDFGDNTFSRLLAAGEDEKQLYLLATDLLIDLHLKSPSKAIPTNLASYSFDKFITEAVLLTDWFVPALNEGMLSKQARLEYRHQWRKLLESALEMPQTLVLRDYHVDNLMRLDDRSGLSACGLLDFQDAVSGPVTYDLISLIEDARRDVSRKTAKAVEKHYLSAFPEICPDQFNRSMAVLGAQRHAKVIGIFTRLCIRDQKSLYLQHIPRVWSLLEKACDHPDLASMREWLDHYVPAKNRRIPEGLSV